MRDSRAGGAEQLVERRVDPGWRVAPRGASSEDPSASHVDIPRVSCPWTAPAAREQLSVDIAYFTKFTEGSARIDVLDGERTALTFAEGSAIPLGETYCRRVVDGTAPSIVPDAAAEPRMHDLPVVDAVGSYLGVPVRLSDRRTERSAAPRGRRARHPLCDGVLRCTVCDPGGGFQRPEVIKPHDDRPGGLGLVMLDSVSDRRGTKRDDSVPRLVRDRGLTPAGGWTAMAVSPGRLGRVEPPALRQRAATCRGAK